MNGFLTSISYSAWALHFILWFPLAAMFVVLAAGEPIAKRIALVAALIEFVESL